MHEEKAASTTQAPHNVMNGVYPHLSMQIEPPEVEMLVIHVSEHVLDNVPETNSRRSGDDGGASGIDSMVMKPPRRLELTATSGARSPTSMSSRIENESECEEDRRREKEALENAKQVSTTPSMSEDLLQIAKTALILSNTASKQPPAANPAAPANQPTPAPPAAVPRPAKLFSWAFLLWYFSKLSGQHGSAHVLGHRKPLHLLFTFIGATLGIGLLGFLHYNIFMEIDYQSNGVFLIGSFGASATLLYGAPTADFSQPRNVWGGHVVSALSGLIISEIIPDSDTNYQTLRAAFAVAFAIIAMNVTHTVHPPGGATALIAVTPNASIQHLHWLYLVLPVAIGAAIMILVAILVNNCTQSRHYPKYWL